jgi:general secretion pathway protein F
MQDYVYEIVKRDGELQTGQIKADSEQDAIRQLSLDGRTVVDISALKKERSPVFISKLSHQELILALHELATLLESGVPLVEAINAQSQGRYHPLLNQAFDRISSSLIRGESLLNALKACNLTLPSYLFQLVEAGEMSGLLPKSLREAVEQMEEDLRVNNEFRNALTYPAILVVSGVAAVILIFIFVVPKFSNLLENGNDLPFLSVLVLSSGVWFNENSWALLGGVLVLALMLVSLFRQAKFREQVMNFLAVTPVLREWLTESDTAKWSSIMAAMLSSRVELMTALDLAQRGVRISRRRKKLEQVSKDVKSGISLAEALEKQDALTPTGYNLIKVGEKSGQLDSMLRSLAKLYSDNSSRRIKQVLTLIEPLAILVLGAVIGTIMVGVILAITSVNDVGL